MDRQLDRYKDRQLDIDRDVYIDYKNHRFIVKAITYVPNISMYVFK